jgi:hypothetical protein
VEHLRGEAKLEEVRSMRCPLGAWDPGPFCFLSLLPSFHAVSKSPLPYNPTIILCATKSPKQQGQVLSKNKHFFLLNKLSQVFCHNDREMINMTFFLIPTLNHVVLCIPFIYSYLTTTVVLYTLQFAIFSLSKSIFLYF